MTKTLTDQKEKASVGEETVKCMEITHYLLLILSSYLLKEMTGDH